MIEIEISDELYPLYITLDNNLLILKERVKRIEDLNNQVERVKECDGLYEALGRIEFVAQKLIAIANYVTPTNCQRKLDHDSSQKQLSVS
jgi:hypothetical protein